MVCIWGKDGPLINWNIYFKDESFIRFCIPILKVEICIIRTSLDFPGFTRQQDFTFPFWQTQVHRRIVWDGSGNKFCLGFPNFGGQFFVGRSKILLLGRALKFGLIFQKFALKLIKYENLWRKFQKNS